MPLYSNKRELFQILENHGLQAKKSLGQNFLINTSILTSIIEEANLNRDDYIIEIGPGLGILTEELIKTVKQVDAIEIDTQIIPYLEKQFQKFPQFELFHQDALKFPLPNKAYKLIANIPYYITSPLLNHFLNPQNPQEKRPTLVVLLVQKEVAEKICSTDGDHSILSLQVQIFGKPKILRKVPPTCFYPAPKVDSVILKIETYENCLVNSPENFFKIIKMCFSQKRKTLANSLQNGLKLDKAQIISLLEKANIDEMKRPQHLNIVDWNKLVEVLEPFMPKNSTKTENYH